LKFKFQALFFVAISSMRLYLIRDGMEVIKMGLCVTNGFSTALPGLGRNRPFKELSEKRVTKATREALRKKYATSDVEVSCSAAFSNGKWKGKCKIQGNDYGYEISI
jgi:hypothetical protein